MPYALIAVFVKVPISVEIFYASNIIVAPVGILNMQMTPWNITNRLWEIVELIQIVPAITIMATITLIPKKVMLLCPKCHPLKIISKLKHVLHVNFWDDLSVLLYFRKGLNRYGNKSHSGNLYSTLMCTITCFFLNLLYLFFQNYHYMLIFYQFPTLFLPLVTIKHFNRWNQYFITCMLLFS